MKKTLTRKKKPKAIVQSKLADLYEPDEVAWLEQSVSLIQQGRVGELDFNNLAEFLESMAISQRREVKSRLTTLIAHLLKWQFQSQNRTGSWKATVMHQRDELGDILESTTLKNHALDVLAKAYERAVRQAAVETGFAVSHFPAECPFSLDYLLGSELPDGTEPD